MSHLPDIALTTFKRGESLSAASLNGNFQALLGLIEIAMLTALTPDAASVGNEVSIAAHGERLATIEHMLTVHARQRNERELTPLAYTAAIMAQVRELREPVMEAAGRLEQAHAHASTLHASHEQRLARLEQQPDRATAEEHKTLAADHAALAEKMTMVLGQLIGLRQEVAFLRQMAMGHARKRNEIEYTPLSTTGFILARLKELEARLEAPR